MSISTRQAHLQSQHSLRSFINSANSCSQEPVSLFIADTLIILSTTLLLNIITTAPAALAQLFQLKMKLLYATMAVLLALPALADEALSGEAAKFPRKDKDKVDISASVSEAKDNKEIIDFIYANVGDGDKPDVVVDSEGSLEFGTIRRPSHKNHHQPHCHHCSEPKYHHYHYPDHYHYPHLHPHPYPHPHRPNNACGECKHHPHRPHRPHKPEKDSLTDCYLCKKLNHFSDELYYLYDIIASRRCQDGKYKC